MSQNAETHPGQQIVRRSGQRSAMWPAAVAAMLGLTILYVVGFAGSHVIHNAAHDARHSLNFPCH
jgi:cobalt transporter subunit CbtB